MPDLIVLPSCASTNSELRERFARGEVAVGAALVSREQTAGRGRMTRTWSPSQDALYFSCLVDKIPVESPTWIGLRVAVAVAQVLDPSCDGRVKIKWPNDLLSPSGSKLGGILCEDALGAVVVGIGLNQVSPGLPKTTGLREIGLAIETLSLARVLSESLPRWFGPGAVDLETVVSSYTARAALPAGCEITWTLGNQVGAARVVGLGKLGELNVRDLEGRDRALFAEDVSVRPV